MTVRTGAVASMIVAGLSGGCGTSEQGEPLLAATLTAEYAGQPFTPEFGFATLYQGSGLIGLGTGPIHCGSEQANAPPSGTNAVVGVPLEVGVHSSVFVQMLQNNGSYEAHGANTGSVTITAVSPESVAGSIGFDYTDDAGKHYAVSGSFEVVHCPAP